MTAEATSAIGVTERQQARAYINPEHLGEGTLVRMRSWFEATPAEPMVFRNFLRPDFAARLAAALRDLPVWQRYCTIYQGTLDTSAVPEAEWHQHPQRAACHNVARPLLDALEPGAMAEDHQRVLKTFLSFAVLNAPLREWIAAGIGFPLERRTSVELASYTPGDQIRRHQDLFPRRVLAVNFYLDEHYRTGQGAQLSYSNEAGEVFDIDPLFNTFSMIPIRENCHHWVTPYLGEGTGRYTVSIGEHRAE
jgi:hypothetical protein